MIASLSLRTKSTDKTPKEKNIQDELNTAIANATQAILEKHKQEKEALEAEISDLKSKQWVGITKDEINDLKANYEVVKDGHKKPSNNICLRIG